jgi:hypothetical protein
MNIKDCVDFLNFWIRKERGAFYTIQEAVDVIDRGQMAYFNDIITKYATSQIIKDTLSTFKERYEFVPGDMPGGLVIVPNRTNLPITLTASAASVGKIIEYTSTISPTLGQYVYVLNGTGVFQPDTYITKIIDDTHFEVNIEPLSTIQIDDIIQLYIYKEFLDLLDITIKYPANGGYAYYSIKMSNEDEIADKLNSQINPPVETAPVGEQIKVGEIQLYPQVDTYEGFVQYMRRPKKPIYGYSVVGGRTIVYNPSQSIQLEWRDSDINTILLKALSSIGINLSDQEVSQFAEIKSQQNYQSVNNL